MRITRTVLAVLLALGLAPAHAANDATDPAPPAPSAARDTGYLDRTGELVVHALALLGIHYRYGGESPTQGFDCSGLVSHVFQEAAGIVLPRNSRAMAKVGEKVGESELQPGDLVFFNTRRRPYSHVGIYIGEDRFVHAPHRGAKVEVSDLHDRYWQKHYNGARRVSF